MRTKSVSCNALIKGRLKFVGSGPHHAAPYIGHSWHVNQSLSVNSTLSEGSDLFGAEVVGCSTISPLPSTSTPGSTPSLAPPPVQVRQQVLRFVLLLPKIELRLKAYLSNLNLTSASPTNPTSFCLSYTIKLTVWENNCLLQSFCHVSEGDMDLRVILDNIFF
jgi:hypothetical protein